jgi:hypothetical protein
VNRLCSGLQVHHTQPRGLLGDDAEGNADSEVCFEVLQNTDFRFRASGLDLYQDARCMRDV